MALPPEVDVGALDHVLDGIWDPGVLWPVAQDELDLPRAMDVGHEAYHSQSRIIFPEGF